MKYQISYLCLAVVFAASCSEMSGNRERGPIVLGDSSTIVTETDAQYLKDEVLDIGPRPAMEKQVEETKPEPTKVTEAVAEKTEDTPTPKVAGKGFNIDFGGVRMVLEGLEAKEIKKQDPVKQSGVAYMLTSPDIAKGKVVIYGAKELTVKQRYQSQLVIRSESGMVDLRNLGLYTSDWAVVNTSGNAAQKSFTLSGLGNPAFLQANNNKITNAADKELRKRRTNSRTIQSWMKEIKKIKKPGDKPSEIILDNVQWQISGKDAKGNAFQKTVRIDV